MNYGYDLVEGGYLEEGKGWASWSRETKRLLRRKYRQYLLELPLPCLEE
jgi:hypothetical protein